MTGVKSGVKRVIITHKAIEIHSLTPYAPGDGEEYGI